MATCTLVPNALMHHYQEWWGLHLSSAALLLYGYYPFLRYSPTHLLASSWRKCRETVVEAVCYWKFRPGQRASSFSVRNRVLLGYDHGLCQ
eukprot:3936948-Rhodomonas_salina.1